MEQVRVLAENLPPEAWRAVIWRQGVAEPLASRFAALRVRPAHGDTRRSEPRPEQWLLVEWPEGEPRPIKFWFSSLPVDPPIERLSVSRQAALADRARLSRAQAGAGPRPLQGARLARLPPPRRTVHRRLRLPGPRAGGDSPSGPGSAWLVKTPVFPDGHRPCGTAAPARASHPAFDRNPAPTHRPRPRSLAR